MNSSRKHLPRRLIAPLCTLLGHPGAARFNATHPQDRFPYDGKWRCDRCYSEAGPQ